MREISEMKHLLTCGERLWRETSRTSVAWSMRFLLKISTASAKLRPMFGAVWLAGWFMTFVLETLCLLQNFLCGVSRKNETVAVEVKAQHVAVFSSLQQIGLAFQWRQVNLNFKRCRAWQAQQVLRG
jgi:hypothetical protein